MATCAVCGAPALSEVNLNTGSKLPPNWEWRCPEHWPAVLSAPDDRGWLMPPDSDRRN